MKTTTVIGSMVTAFCLLGCSGGGDPAPKVTRIVPTKAEEIASSPDYKFERTTKTGVKIYIRPLTPEMVGAISANSPDRAFLNKGDQPYLMVPIRDDKIVELTKDERAELAGVMIEKMITSDPMLRKSLGDDGKAR